MSWSNCRWDSTEQMFELLWGQLKTGRQKVINFPCDYDCPEMDFYHAMASYLLTYKTEAAAVFPFLKNLTGSSAPAISNRSSDLCPEIESS